MEELTVEQLAERTSIGFLPMEDRVVVEQFSEEQVSAGGIIIPDQSQEKPNVGRVVAIGEGKLIPEMGGRIHCPYRLGHIVLFGKYAGYKFEKTVAGQEYKRQFFSLREDEVIGIDLDFKIPAPPVAQTPVPDVVAPSTDPDALMPGGLIATGPAEV